MDEDAHGAVAEGIAERFLLQPHSMAWEQRCDELATAAIEAMQMFISFRRIHPASVPMQHNQIATDRLA